MLNLRSSIRNSRARLVAIGAAVLVALAPLRAPALGAQASTTQASKHIFYRVTGPSGATIYLLGAVHLLPEDAHRLPPVVDSAFEHAKAVVFETSLDSLELRATELVAKAQYAEGATLRASLTPDAVPRVESILAGYGTNLDQVARFKPWFVTLALQQAVAQRAGYQAQYGVDAQLNARAKAENKTRLALEPVEFQLGLFDGMTPAQQQAELLETKPPLDALKELLTMTALWLEGNAAGLDSVTHAGESPSTAAVTGAVLTKRNQNWLPQIDAWVRGHDDMLVVVGAAHLVGTQGIVEMLRAKGFKVEQL